MILFETNIELSVEWRVSTLTRAARLYSEDN